MTKTCHACNYEVPESHTGKCPSCGKEAGYAIFRSITETIKIHDSVKTKLKKLDINPKKMGFTIDAVLVKQKELEKSVVPLTKVLTNIDMKKLIKQLETAVTATEKLRSRLSNIKIPSITSATTSEEHVSDEAIEEAVEELEEIKEEIPEKENETESLSNSIKNLEDKMNTQHTEQMAEHQKTRDELLIEVDSQNDKIESLEQEVKDGWKKPKNWGIGLIIATIFTIIAILI